MSQQKGLLMKRLLMIGTIGAVILVVAPCVCIAGLNYNASKSNTGYFVVSYDVNIITLAQAGAILTDLEKEKAEGQPVDEDGVREVMRKQGVQNDHVKKIIIETEASGKSTTILLLSRREDENAGRAAVEVLTGQPSGKRQH
jgi:hypothetical protein